ncbi:hypothetical protein KL914_002128 [Ogataea haglerorum]|uniref:Uncharacterized protein n=1 Tax=Ogataea haglerorum TaxID=1937702 RepID=A0ABQ7RK85_9ASCO|nr:hypothetical protein KL915_001898 [Ogataea haglerorum]KAG7708402.1 hypothetical protein KL914_002128 [Ogataea haglerorum]KAG7760409.1 hypothetical protein KL947_001253 [Ogataea haglerorum]KAG7767272.1 hypothetical protein KL946_001371 [Ogataea haglerorum]KAG7792658.1 hypothetical protein KL910_000898 [Ogataea haglerorum]
MSGPSGMMPENMFQNICRSIGLVRSGRKADIAGRLEQFFSSGKYQGDNARLLAVRALIMKASIGQELPPYQVLYATYRTNAHTIHVPNQYTPDQPSAPPPAPAPVPRPAPTTVFKRSDFYSLRQRIHANGMNPVLAPQKIKDRGCCRFVFNLLPEERQLLTSSPNMRACLISAQRSASMSEQDLEFPQPNEITLNGIKLKQTGRGIKGKPGSAKPIDLTEHLRLGETNRLDVVYAFTNVDFWLYLYIVETIPVSLLLDRIVNKAHISEQQTIESIMERHQEDDDDLIQTEKEVVSLMCPCSFIKMRYPCRSTKCRHIQCFDALSFLQLQQQAPTWQCPVCSSRIELSDLALDDYFLKIVEQTGEDDEAIEIDEQGNWTIKHETEQSREQSEQPQAHAKSEEPVAVISLDSEDDEEDAQEMQNDVHSGTNSALQQSRPESTDALSLQVSEHREGTNEAENMHAVSLPPAPRPRAFEVISLESDEETDVNGSETYPPESSETPNFVEGLPHHAQNYQPFEPAAEELAKKSAAHSAEQKQESTEKVSAQTLFMHDTSPEVVGNGSSDMGRGESDAAQTKNSDPLLGFHLPL